jgi:hypothetical protein
MSGTKSTRTDRRSDHARTSGRFPDRSQVVSRNTACNAVHQQKREVAARSWRSNRHAIPSWKWKQGLGCDIGHACGPLTLALERDKSEKAPITQPRKKEMQCNVMRCVTQCYSLCLLQILCRLIVFSCRVLENHGLNNRQAQNELDMLPERRVVKSSPCRFNSVEK